VSFATLALICAAALVGPIIATPRRLYVPMLIGELAAGVALGRTGVAALHPQNVTFTFLAEVGFALIMFVAGSQVPIRDPRVRRSLRTGATRAAAVAVGAVGLGIALAAGFDTGHAALYAVLLASSSAALVLPLFASVGLLGPSALSTISQVAIADTVCIVALPLAIDPARAGRAALGALAVAAATVVVWLLLRQAEASGARKRVHHLSERRHFALELRISLLTLFALAALAVATHVSVLLAGFGLGLAVAAVGEPRRLAHQLFALTEGFFGPLFFVWIGASLDLRALGAHPKYVLLGLALGAGAVLVHAAMRLTGQTTTLAVAASAQLGVPIAAVALGAQRHLLRPGEPAALLLGALVTIAAASGAAAVQAMRNPPAPRVEHAVATPDAPSRG
jgi:Kef-type K+ transport system membrane component KefB